MQLEFLDRCVNEDERLPLVQSRQLQYWERLLYSSKDESNASLIDREPTLCLSKVIHSCDIRSMFGSWKVTQFHHLCALYEGLDIGREPCGGRGCQKVGFTGVACS